MDKETLIKYIKTTEKFYQFANMQGYSMEQLVGVKERIDRVKQGTKYKEQSKAIELAVMPI